MQPGDGAGPRPLHFQVCIDLNRVRDLAVEASKSNQQLTKIGENAPEITFYSLFFHYFYFVTARLKSNGNKTHCTNVTLI